MITNAMHLASLSPGPFPRDERTVVVITRWGVLAGVLCPAPSPLPFPATHRGTRGCCPHVMEKEIRAQGGSVT